MSKLIVDNNNTTCLVCLYVEDLSLKSINDGYYIILLSRLVSGSKRIAGYEHNRLLTRSNYETLAISECSTLILIHAWNIQIYVRLIFL